MAAPAAIDVSSPRPIPKPKELAEVPKNVSDKLKQMLEKARKKLQHKKLYY